MSADYLHSFSKNCDVKALKKIWDERSQWMQRDSAKKYRELIDRLPIVDKVSTNFEKSIVEIGKRHEVNDENHKLIIEMAKELIPWRKGPFNIFGIDIDAEWKSDLKWDRIKYSLGDLKDKKILDIGCNNGYFLYRMVSQKPKLLLGIDPILHVQTQFRLLNHFAQVPCMHHELLGVEHMHLFKEMFDVVLSMGIIYHHRHPLQQLLDIREALKPGGQILIETLGIPGQDSISLCPIDRYANMKNVYFIPTINCLKSWLVKTKYTDIQVVSTSPMTVAEQRLTNWCPPPHQSFENFLDPIDHKKTVEGHPAPIRFALSARKKKI